MLPPGSGGEVRQAVDLGEAVPDVQTESVHAAIEPEPQEAAELLLHPRVGSIEVGL